MAEIGILLRIFFSHDIAIRLSKRSEVFDDLTAAFIKSTLLAVAALAQSRCDRQS